MATRSGQEAAESLEALEDRVWKAQEREEEDEEAALVDLMEAMIEAEPAGREDMPEDRKGTEFTCSSCRLIYSRSCLADEERLICIDCAREESQGRAPGGRERHGITIEAPCPACGEILMVPEREDAACGFFCPGCGVHVRRWRGHLHLVWNHRQALEHLPRHEPKAS